MKIHTVTIKEASNIPNKKFDNIIVSFEVPREMKNPLYKKYEKKTSTYRINVKKNHNLVLKFFEYTDIISSNVKDLIGKSIRVCISNDNRIAIGHPVENRFLIINDSEEERTLEYLKEKFK